MATPAKVTEIKAALAADISEHLISLQRYASFEGHKIEVTKITGLKYQLKALPLVEYQPGQVGPPRYFNVTISEMM